MTPRVDPGSVPGAGGTDGGPADAGADGAAGGPVLDVESVAVGGDGVAREESGRVVFVPRTAPGDRVRVRITEEHGSYARARPVEVVREGPGRREAPCPYYAACGGCQVQHLAYEEQLEAKRRAVADTLERIGGREVEVPPAVEADRRLGYRNRVTLTLRRGPDGGRLEAGYHRWDAPGRLADVHHCPLAEAPLARAWSRLRETWGPNARRLPPGRELRLTLRASSSGRVTLLAEQETPEDGAGRGGGDATGAGEPEAVAEAVDGLAGYFWRPAGGERRLLAGDSRMRERWLGLELRLGPETFLQVNRTMTRKMEGWLDRLVEERAGGPEGLRMLDLHAGVGARAVRWARAGAEAASCEIQREAVRCGREAAERLGVDVEARAGAVEDELVDLLPADVAVVNPPRDGLSRPTATRLAGAPLGALAYVSCDPATLARDIDRLGDGWTLASIRAFDAFPQTAHVETVAWLEPA